MLETRLCTPAGDLTITDWMPAGQEAAKGLLYHRDLLPVSRTVLSWKFQFRMGREAETGR